MNIFKTALLFLCCCLIFSIQAQEYLFNIQHINVEEGLPDRRVLNIIQDKKGFIWVNTPGAISRYDGYQFKTYNADFLNVTESTSLKLAVDQQNNLWYWKVSDVTKPLIGIVNTETDVILSVEEYTKGLFSAQDIVAFSSDRVKKEVFYISTKNGELYKYDKIFELIAPKIERLNSYFLCEEAADSTYWLLNAYGVIHIDKHKTQSYSVSAYPHRIIRTTPTVVIQTNYVDSETEIFQELVNGRFVPYIADNHSDDRYYKILQESYDFKGHLTSDSLTIQYQSSSASFSNKEIMSPCTDCLIRPMASMVDAQNNYWIATENGIIKISLSKNPFTTLEKGNSLRGIYRNNNHLWIGGYRGNTRYDLTTNEVESFARFPNWAAFSFYEDERKHIWAAGGGTLLEYATDELQQPVIYDKQYAGYTALLYNKATEKLLIGTERTLLYFDEKTKTTQPINAFTNKEILVRQLYQNEKGIWVVSNNGLFLMDTQTEEIIQHYTTKDGLPSNNINHVYEDRIGDFWLATKGDGVIHWDIPKNRFTQYTTANGLSNNTIYAVYEDGFNNLWLPSNYGLMCFNKQSLSTKVYLPKQGIAHEEFNTYAHFQAADGTLYFGGLNGLTQFHPNDIFQQNDSLPLYVNEVNILKNNAEHFINRTDDFKQSRGITLQPDDRILEVSFSLLDYGQSTINQYAYKIEGYQNQWIYTKENKISLINMPYGNYNLVIKGRGSTGDWSASQITIPLEIKVPFYKKSWFIGLIIFLGSISIIALVKWRIEKLEKDRTRLEEEVRKRTAELEKDKQIITKQAEALKQLDKTKTRFFSNITHEFRTPLTLIIGPTEQLLKIATQKSRRPLSGVLKNAKQLLGLINQLLDLSKLESRSMKVTFFRGNIVTYTQELIERFQPMATKKSQQLTFMANSQEWETYFDKDKWNKIIYNLVSNAIKFTPTAGVIQISLSKGKEGDKENIQLEVKDNGVGIKATQLSQIFNRFYQTDTSSTREQEGTGIGLSLVKELVELQKGEILAISEVGKGTSFILKIPVPVAVTPAPALSVNVKGELESQLIPAPLIEVAPLPNVVLPNPKKTTSEQLEVLIIEDNEDMRGYIRSCIDEKVYHITEASNGEEGIQQAIATIPDLIISDVMMPKKDGFEVTKTLRSTLITSHIPIVLLTAKASLESRLEGLRHGADAYLSKPFSPDELLLRIQKLIEIRQLLQLRYTHQLDKHASKTGEQFAVEDVFVQELKTYILENIINPLNGDIIGKQFGMSRMQLHRKLKALTNQSISELIKIIRLEKAFELLQAKQLNVSEVAYQIGFSSPNHFSRVFKEKFGKSPSEM